MPDAIFCWPLRKRDDEEWMECSSSTKEDTTNTHDERRRVRFVLSPMLCPSTAHHHVRPSGVLFVETLALSLPRRILGCTNIRKSARCDVWKYSKRMRNRMPHLEDAPRVSSTKADAWWGSTNGGTPFPPALMSLLINTHNYCLVRMVKHVRYFTTTEKTQTTSRPNGKTDDAVSLYQRGDWEKEYNCGNTKP